jgi:O-antigen ligase
MLLLALAACARVPARHLAAGTTCGLTAICLYALATRLHPDWFDESALTVIFDTARRRLAEPLGYWNALAGLAALTAPLLLSFASDARRIVTRSLAAACVPVVVAVIFLTVSRGGVFAIVVAVAVWFCAAPDRLPKLAVMVVTGAASAVTCLAADRREALQDGLGNEVAARQGDELTTILLLAMAGVALVTAGVGLLARHATRPRSLRVPRRVAGGITGLAVVAAATGGLVAGGPTWVDDRFEEFKGRSAAPLLDGDNSVSRLDSIDSNGRWAYWQVLRDAQREDPLTGAGPGTFEYLWAQNNPDPASGFVRDGHSLYAEALGEMGAVGLALVVLAFGTALVGGALRALRARDLEHRAALAAAVGALAGFCSIAVVEWAWEMTVLGAAAMVMVAVALAGRADAPLGQATMTRSVPPAERALVGVLSFGAIVAIAVPTATTADIRSSQEAAAAGDLRTAFRQAGRAVDAQPYSASALMQRALVLERAGALREARGVATRATEEEQVNWRTWLVRSRLEARTGDVRAALASYRRARELNPRSPIFRR